MTKRAGTNPLASRSPAQLRIWARGWGRRTALGAIASIEKWASLCAASGAELPDELIFAKVVTLARLRAFLSEIDAALTPPFPPDARGKQDGGK